MICSRIFAGVDQSILRSTRNPLLNQDDSRCTTSRSSAARSLLPFISESRSARIETSSLAPRFGCKMQIAGIVVARLRAPTLDRLRQLFAVRAVVTGESCEERLPSGGVKRVVAVEHVAGD